MHETHLSSSVQGAFCKLLQGILSFFIMEKRHLQQRETFSSQKDIFETPLISAWHSLHQNLQQHGKGACKTGMMARSETYGTRPFWVGACRDWVSNSIRSRQSVSHLVRFAQIFTSSCTHAFLLTLWHTSFSQLRCPFPATQQQTWYKCLGPIGAVFSPTPTSFHSSVPTYQARLPHPRHYQYLTEIFADAKSGFPTSIFNK